MWQLNISDKKTRRKRKKWMEFSCVVFQNCPLSFWSRGKVFFIKAFGVFEKSLFVKLSPSPRAGMLPKTL